MTCRLLWLAAGVIGGLAYWRVIGCWTGQCMISGDPLTSGAWFGILGWVLGGGGQEVGVLVDRARGIAK